MLAKKPIPPPRKLSAASTIMLTTSTNGPAPLNGYANTPGNRTKKPFSAPTVTCTGTTSTPHWRQTFICVAPKVRAVMQKSQKNRWHLGQCHRPGDLGWNLHGCELVIMAGAATGGAAITAVFSVAARAAGAAPAMRATGAPVAMRGGGNPAVGDAAATAAPGASE